MTIDVDQILRAHAAEAERTEPDPEAWARLVARLDETPPLTTSPTAPPRGGTPTGHTTGQGRWPLLAAAAVLVVVAVSAAVALVRAADGGEATTPATAPTTEIAPAPEDETGEPGTATDPEATDAEPSTDTQPTPETSVADPDGGRPEIAHETMPDSVVAVLDADGDGLADLVRLEAIGLTEDVPGPNGTTARGMQPPVMTVLVPGSDVTPVAITSVDVGPDGTAYYAVGGEIWKVDGTSGLASGPIAVGAAPAVSGDGATLATVVDGVIRIHELDVVGGHPIADLPTGGEVTALALSPDGSQIARQRVTRAADATVTATAVDVTSIDDPTGWVEVRRSSGVGMPAFMPDGHLAVGLGTSGTSVGHDEARSSDVGMVDLSTGEVRWSVGGGGFSVTTFDATPDGRWVLVAQEDVVRAFAAVDGWLWDSGTIVQAEGIVDVAW